MDSTENIKTLLVEDELKNSYLTYAMSVIVSRALPDARDGLKPSQRRIMVAMNDLGLGPRSKYRKCAKIAGDTSGNYHPHGEQVVYPTLVRMAQDFSLRYTLVEGQGNFGSIDGDPPAAMRYTEARMTRFSTFMLEDMEKDTVNFTPNYDETREEPTVLPSKFPNLICNGSSGIAVGMATSIPPHNLNEVCDALVHLIDHPDTAVMELMNFIKGPDFPTGGTICGSSRLRQAYATGRGIISVRATLEVEDRGKGRQSIIVSQLPYNVNKTRIIEQIVSLVKTDQIQGISDIRDESDRTGMRLVIDLKKGEDDQIISNQLYKRTSLQDSFSIIMVALVDQRPKVLNLKQILVEYIKHRKVVITRRTQFLLKRAEHEAHILEGLAKALEFIDEIIAIIKSSKTPKEAGQSLRDTYSFSVIQSDAILKMTLQRLTGLEQDKIREELKKLQEMISDFNAILSNESLVMDIIREDIFELKEKYGDDRRTRISMEEIEDFSIEELIPDDEMSVTMSHNGFIKRVPLTEYKQQRRGGKGIIGSSTKDADFIEHFNVASTHDYILFFTDSGIVHWKKVYSIPNLSRTSKGKPVSAMLQMREGDRVTTMIPVKNFEQGYLVMATRKGMIKKTPLSAYSRPQKGGIRAIKLHEDDQLIGVNITTGNDEIVLGTTGGKAIRFSEDNLRPMGRATSGVRGIKLAENDAVIDMIIVNVNSTILTVCELGYGKRTSIEEYRMQTRGGKGVINIKVTEKNGSVIGMKSVEDSHDLMMITQSGKIVRTPIKDIRSIGRSTQGVRLISLREDDTLVSIAKVEDGNGDHSEDKEHSPVADESTMVDGQEPLDDDQE